ncbi:MAG: protein phosphatase CheZ [Alphaproteobacteria bacterium]|jgi:chemotaxis protein CheZ|nr:protein phosphatase CheZ [Alphaproteobacteria bacterium]
MTSLSSKRMFTAERNAMARVGSEMLAEVHASPLSADESGVTNAEVLAAIESLGEQLAELGAAPSGGGNGAAHGGGADIADDTVIKIEIAQMVRSIGRTKQELASIKHPMSDDDRIGSATNQLDAIVEATESATNEILQVSENVGKIIDEIGKRYPDDHELISMSEDAAADIIRILEACSFQDITGQRVTKVVETIRFIQEKILGMIEIFGTEAFADLPVEPAMADDEETDERALLNGPQLENEGLSQDDIDALFD